jgi:hypothetical protein
MALTDPQTNIGNRTGVEKHAGQKRAMIIHDSSLFIALFIEL